MHCLCSPIESWDSDVDASAGSLIAGIYDHFPVNPLNFVTA